jgi:cellulose synthase/poly-beta-1,6-N-acetylglucosamine synthase-like glycosyltransferase
MHEAVVIHAVDVLLFVLTAAVATLAAPWCVYLGLALLLSRRAGEPPPSTRSLRVDIVVPAHDEAAVIARCLASLRRIEWPPDRYRVIVVADNCVDRTAEIARDAGARMLERRAPDRRAKGYALQWAFQLSQRDGWADAVAVIDADSVVSANLIEAFASRIELGAHAVQVRYGVLNAATSWRTRLMAIAQGAFHVVRSRARERLRLSCGIRGNGWCVTHALLKRVPYAAFSLAEDLEYGIELGMAGFRVHYADEASVVAEAVSGSASARRQRQRWEWGRAKLRRARAWPLLATGLLRPSRVCLDLALDLLVPPLSRIASSVAVLVLGALLAFWLNPLFSPLLWLGLTCASVVSLYVLRGWSLSGTGLRGLIDLACAPAFVIWKVVAVRGSRAAHVWTRTDREKS